MYRLDCMPEDLVARCDKRTRADSKKVKIQSVNGRRTPVVARTAGSHDLGRGLGTIALLAGEEVADAEDDDPDDAGDAAAGSWRIDSRVRCRDCTRKGFRKVSLSLHTELGP